MSELVLVRHGQAASFSADGDRLTELGERQLEVLARYWVGCGVAFDEVRSGTLRRQVQSERIVARVFASAGKPWPEPIRDPDWNEYDSPGVMGRLLPALAERDPEFRTLVQDFEKNREHPDKNRWFQRMFEVLVDHWLRGDSDTDGVEPFRAFHARVLAARDRIRSGPGGRKVAVFCSGGTIGVCVQAALDAPHAAALKVNWRVRNASLTEFTYSRDRISLDAFNAIPHLDDPALVSYR
jgi:broad specificity phosphatase PhoE